MSSWDTLCCNGFPVFFSISFLYNYVCLDQVNFKIPDKDGIEYLYLQASSKDLDGWISALRRGKNTFMSY